jgi:hypothetical protein
MTAKKDEATPTREPGYLDEALEALSAPFDPGVVQWKAGATARDRCLAVPYVDMRRYIDRLNEVCGAAWRDDIEIVGEGGSLIIVRLTVMGVQRVDVGEVSESDKNTATAAIAQAFKRACVKFGLGAYLYNLPNTWVDYDPQRKRIKPSEMARLIKVLQGIADSPPGDDPPPDQASEEPASSEEPAGDDGGNGGNGIPTSPADMRTEVNTRLKANKVGYQFPNIKAMLEAVRVEAGDEKMSWPTADDTKAWRKVGNLAMAHAKKAAK